MLLLLALLACRSTSKESPAPSGTPKPVVISQGSDGGVTVSGGQPMRGDPKVCAAFTACCKHPEMGMFCALTQAASKGDCQRALEGARTHLDERGLTAPDGCK